nr:MAG: hypothetical protein J07AB56_09080 [Candidatus Nanosalinarum sp. J07AB56]
MKLMISRATDDPSLPPSINVDVLETDVREFPQTEDELASFMLECHGPGKYTVMTNPSNYNSVWKAWVAKAQRTKALTYLVLDKNRLEPEINAEDNAQPGKPRQVTNYPSKVPEHVAREHTTDADDLPDSCFKTPPTYPNPQSTKPDSRKPR